MSLEPKLFWKDLTELQKFPKKEEMATYSPITIRQKIKICATFCKWVSKNSKKVVDETIFANKGMYIFWINIIKIVFLDFVLKFAVENKYVLRSFIGRRIAAAGSARSRFSRYLAVNWCKCCLRLRKYSYLLCLCT